MTEEKIEKGYVKGVVSHVIFQNEENYYTVANVRVVKTNEEIKEKQVTIVGTLPVLEIDETFIFYGHIVDHPRFGLQYKVDQFERDIPKTTQGLIRYLSSSRFPGIGKKTAEAIVTTLGERAISKIIEDRSVLNEIKGLSKKRADELYEQLVEQQGFEQVLLTLSKYGFGVELAMKIYNEYGIHTLDVIETNPYQLMIDVEGIGFRRADILGAAIGLVGNHPERIRAGCLYLLHELCLAEGHVYLEKDVLIDQATRLLSSRDELVTEEEVEEKLLFMDEEGMIIIEEDRLYMKSLYFAEKGIVSSVRKLLSTEIESEFPQSEFLKALGQVEEEMNIEFAPTQREAIETAISSPFMILTGGPGTGKTTVIKAIVETYARLNGLSLDEKAYTKGNPFPILLVAPTGRAAKRMSEATGLSATTIHRLLGWKGGSSFEKGEDEKLEGELLIVDETSMVDIWLMNQLLKSVPKNMRVILVGDHDQLPSVGPGQVLHDFLKSEIIPTVSLHVIYRQEEGSSIIDLAHEIKQKKVPKNITARLADRRFFPCQAHQVQAVVSQICESAIKKGYTAKDIQVLAPMYKGQAGITELNALLQQLFNPAKDGKREIRYGEVVYRTGDVVLQLVNNPEENVYNGDRGEIVAIIYAKENVEKTDQIVISFDGIEVTYAKKDLNQITHAYCCSIHKSQGSEFPIVVLPVVHTYRRMLRKNLLYTAITRSTDSLIICGEIDAFMNGIEMVDTDKRYTTLEKLLQLKLTGKIKDESVEEEIDSLSPYDFM